MNLKTVEKMSLWLVSRIFWPALQLILALGSAIAVTGRLALDAAAMQARVACLNDGPSPTAQNSGNMPQARLTIHYNKQFMKFLTANLVHMRLCSMMDLPEKAGQTFRNFMMIPTGANIQQQTEGTIGPPVTINVNFKDIIVGQWADYTNFSDLAFMTSISNDLENYRHVMAYRLGLTIDQLVMVMFDYLRTLDANTANQDSLTTPYPFNKSIIEQMPQSLLGAKVLPMKTGYFYGKIHPFFVGDMAIDNSNNSVVDILKHTPEGQLKLEALTDADEGEEPIRVIELFGCRWLSSTNCTQTAAWQGGSATGISTYLAGNDAVVFVNFPNKRHTRIDPKWQNMALWAGEYPRNSAYDPAGLIMAGTSYNTVLGIGPPPDTVSRARIAIAVPQTT